MKGIFILILRLMIWVNIFAEKIFLFWCYRQDVTRAFNKAITPSNLSPARYWDTGQCNVNRQSSQIWSQTKLLLLVIQQLLVLSSKAGRLMVCRSIQLCHISIYQYCNIREGFDLENSSATFLYQSRMEVICRSLHFSEKLNPRLKRLVDKVRSNNSLSS